MRNDRSFGHFGDFDFDGNDDEFYFPILSCSS